MNDRAAVAMALATLVKPGHYVSSRKEWAALVKRRLFDKALEAECLSWPRETGVYERWFYTSFDGAPIIRHQTVVVAQVEERLVIVISKEGQLNSVEIAAVGGFYELIRRELTDLEVEA